MAKTLTYLKELAVNRATLAGELECYQDLLGEIAEKARLATQKMAACDLMIRKYDARLEPKQIPARRILSDKVKAPDLRRSIVAILGESACLGMTADELAWRLQMSLGLTFEAPAKHARWRYQLVAEHLTRLVAEGIVEEASGATASTQDDGRWRLTAHF
jgi:hypothetical protein